MNSLLLFVGSAQLENLPLNPFLYVNLMQLVRDCDAVVVVDTQDERNLAEGATFIFASYSSRLFLCISSLEIKYAANKF